MDELEGAGPKNVFPSTWVGCNDQNSFSSLFVVDDVGCLVWFSKEKRKKE